LAACAGHRSVIDYLAAEVLSRQPEEVGIFLRQTAILERLCGSVCDAVTGRADSKALLAWLEALPDSTMRAHRDLSGFKAWLLYLRGRIDEAEAYPALSHSVEGPASPVHSETLLAFQAYLAMNRGDPKQALPLAREAFEQLCDTQSFFRTCALSLLGHAQRFSGDHKAAIETLRQAVQLGRTLGNHLITLDALGSSALLMYAQGQLREAMLLCQQAVNRYVDARKTAACYGSGVCTAGRSVLRDQRLESALNCLTTGIALCQ
jgi:LuxR family maltose regulon positive regulatory protein